MGTANIQLAKTTFAKLDPINDTLGKGLTIEIVSGWDPEPNPQYYGLWFVAECRGRGLTCEQTREEILDAENLWVRGWGRSVTDEEFERAWENGGRASRTPAPEIAPASLAAPDPEETGAPQPAAGSGAPVADTLALRLRLLENGFEPVVVAGKRPVMNGWQLLPTTAESLREWTHRHPNATNTGDRARNAPALDIDITHQGAAEAIEALARQHFAARGDIHVRIGLPPKRLIPLRTDAPFRKLTCTFTAPIGADGKPPKIEILADGQQYVVAGIHPDTGKPYRWINGAGDMDVRDIRRDDLPLVTAEDCEAFLADAAKLLVEKFGFVGASPLPGKPAREQMPPIQVADKFKHLGSGRPLGEGIEEYPPLPFAPIKAGCAFLRVAFETGGKDYDNSLWNLTNLISVFLEDGEKLIHAFSKGHEDYTEGETTKEWHRKNREHKEKGIGWPKCQTIKDNGCKHCDTCPILKLGKSPLNLGLGATGNDNADAGPTSYGNVDDETEEDIEEAKALGGWKPPEMRLPRGFWFNQNNKLCACIPSQMSGKKVIPGKLLQLVSNKIGPPSLQFQNGHFGIGFTASTDKTGTTEVFLTSTQCYRPELLKQLARKAVMYTPGKDTELLESFVVAWMNKLQEEDVAVRDHGTLGWRYRDGEIVGFVYGDILYHEDGTQTPLVAATDDEFRRHYLPTGSRDAWMQAAKLLTDRKRPELDCLISVAFAAPLVTFAGTLYGPLLSVCGNTGSSKSTAQQVTAAVWGNFKQTRESLTSTPKSVLVRLGRTKNLPAYWDDIQNERHQQALFEATFVASEGAEGGRLHTDASYKARHEWQTLMVACSNHSFVEYLIKKQKSTTAGMRRVFEFECNKKDNEPGMVNPLEASQAFARLEHNFGRIGAEYAKILAMEHKAIAATVSEITDDFRAEVDGSGDENHWWGICGVLLAGATLARRLGAEMDVPAMRAFLIEAYHHNRDIRRSEGTEGGSQANTEHSLTAFLNFYVGGGNAIHTDKVFVHKHFPVENLQSPGLNHPIYVQVVRDQRLIIISKRALREYLEKHEIQVRQVYNGLVRYFNARDTRHTLGAGTVHAQAQERCFEIPVHEGQKVLCDLLVARGPVRDDPELRAAFGESQA